MEEIIESYNNKYRNSLLKLKRIRDREIRIERSIIEIVGEGALEIFLKGVEGFLFSDSVLEQAVVHADSEIKPVERARMNYLYMEYLTGLVQSRLDGVKKNIMDSLGEEAYYRIVRYSEFSLED